MLYAVRVLTGPICWMCRLVTPPPSFGGESPAREESLLVEQPQRIPGGRIGLFDSGLKDP